MLLRYKIEMIKEFLKRTLGVIVLCVVAFSSSAQNGGASSYNFLDITTSSKIFGLGGVNISMVDSYDVMTTEQNPSLLGPEMSRSIAVGYMRYVGGSNFANAKYANAAGENGAWAVGLQYFGYGSVTSALPDGTITGRFSPMDMAFIGQYSHNLSSRWRGGITLKFLLNSYDTYTAMAIATDLGVNYYDPETDQSVSLVVANLGGQVKKFNNVAERLPFDVRLGWSGALGNLPFNLSITAWNLTRWSLPYWNNGNGNTEPQLVDKFFPNLFRHLVFGLEWRPSESFYVNLGYNYTTRTDMATYSRNLLSGFSIGAGLKVRAFGVGVSFAQHHQSAATFMLNLTTNLYDF